MTINSENEEKMRKMFVRKKFVDKEMQEGLPKLLGILHILRMCIFIFEWSLQLIQQVVQFYPVRRRQGESAMFPRFCVLQKCISIESQPCIKPLMKK